MIEKAKLLRVAGAVGILMLTAPQKAKAIVEVTAAQIPAEYVRMPNGLFKHPSCVFKVPNGSVINPNWDVTVGGNVVGHVPNCDYPTLTIASQDDATLSDGHNIATLQAASSEASPATTYSGSELGFYYVGANGENNPYGSKWVDRLTGSWTVPLSNAGSGSVQIDLWIGLEPTDYSFVIQPVVQSSFSGGWEMFAAYVPNSGTTIESDAITVYLGDRIDGSLDSPRTYPPGPSCNSQGLCMWLVAMWDRTTGTSTGIWLNLDASVNRPMTRVQGGVLEFPSVTACSDFPSPGRTNFTNLAVFVPYPNYSSFQLLQFHSSMPPTQPYWTSKSNPNPLLPAGCGWRTGIGTTEIDLYY